nr:hypothetical protein [Tanacetum cinerariifolium]
MVTRAKAGIFKPPERMNCHVTTTLPLLHSHVHALRDPNWKEALLDEYNALITNETWLLVPRPANVNVVRSIPMVKPATIRTVLSLAISRDWPIHQHDVKNAFLHALLQRIIALLHSEFLNYFLGISFQRSSSGMFLYQSKFTEEILERAYMQNCNPCKTPVDIESKLGLDGDLVNDPTLYRSLVGALQYLTFTQSDLSYSVQQVCLYMHDPHFTALKLIPRYVRGTLDYGFQLHVSSTTPVPKLNIVALLMWLLRLRGFVICCVTPLFIATLVYCDNVSAVYMSINPVQHQRTKHIKIDIHFVRDFVAKGVVRVLHVPSRFQYADIFTKGLPSALFLEILSSLNVQRPLVLTTGEY